MYIKKGSEMQLSISHCSTSLLALPTKARILCFRFIIEYSSLRDFGPQVVVALFWYEDV
jgi:hypothetical protein